MAERSEDATATAPEPVLRRGTEWLAGVDPAAAAWVRRHGAAPGTVPTVVVVGETKRGKSSLVNALLARQGLSPADAVAPTSAYVVLRHGAVPAVTAHRPGVPPVDVPFEDRAAWLVRTVEGDGGPPPHWVDVEIDIPLLRRLTLVDTPGVGGLHESHGDLAREAVAAATAVLFVLDSGAPLTRGELEFLAALGDGVETVLFALARTDAHRDWRAVLDADRALLAERAPRFAAAPCYPVSARLFEMAAGAGADLAPVLRRRSGIAELQLGLQRLVGDRAGALAWANGLRALCTAVDGVVAGLRTELRALESGAECAGALRERRAALDAARRDCERGWQIRLRTEIQRARVECAHQVSTLVRDAHLRLRGTVDTADRAGLAALPYQVDAALRALAAQLDTRLGAAVGGIADAVLTELFPPDEIDAVRRGLVRGADVPAARPPGPRARSVEDTLLVAVGFSGGLGIGRLAALPLAELGLAAGALVLPFSLALGLGAGWWIARTRRHAADRAHLAQWLADVLTQARSTLDHAVSAQLIDVEQRLALLLDQALARRVAALDDELRQVDRALRMEHTARLAEIDDRAARLAEAIRQRDRVLAALDRIRDEC